MMLPLLTTRALYGSPVCTFEEWRARIPFADRAGHDAISSRLSDPDGVLLDGPEVQPPKRRDRDAERDGRQDGQDSETDQVALTQGPCERVPYRVRSVREWISHRK